MHEHERFGHREHIQFAFEAIRHHGMPAAVEHVCAEIRRKAEYARAPQKYHETISRAWLEIVAHHIDEEADFGTFIAHNPELLDKRLLSRHYRSPTLAGETARTSWIEPDLLPFPWRGGQR
jgi:hypothetical protein